jgi:hypothetical protein
MPDRRTICCDASYYKTTSTNSLNSGIDAGNEIEIMRLRAWSLPAVLAGMLLSCPGCQPTSDRGAAADGDGQAWLLSDEPPAARGILEIKDELTGGETPDQWTEVVLLARVGGVGEHTWDPERAAFTVLDLSAVDDVSQHKSSDHDADQCPFCRAKERKLLECTAVVEIVDAAGQVPAVDARQLLGLKEGQDIVVRGRARIDSLGGLSVQADGVFVRPDATAPDATEAGP